MNIWHDRNVLVYEWQLAEALDLLHCGLFNVIGPYLCVDFLAVKYLLHNYGSLLPYQVLSPSQYNNPVRTLRHVGRGVCNRGLGAGY